jgi:hypothetical protein
VNASGHTLFASVIAIALGGATRRSYSSITIR